MSLLKHLKLFIKTYLKFKKHDRLSFVIPLALGNTGRPGSDLDRAKILLDSCVKFVDPSCAAVILVICPDKDISLIRHELSSYQDIFKLVFMSEEIVCPILSLDPNTENTWPQKNKGWYRQQLIKLAAYKHINTPFYMTLDSDVVFKKAFNIENIFSQGKALVNIETYDDYQKLYVSHIVDSECRVRTDRYKDAERVLKLTSRLAIRDYWYGETPVILSRAIVRRLVKHIAKIWRTDWQSALLANLPWTEYPLYFTFAETKGLFYKYHKHGSANSISSLAQSLWLDPPSYTDRRSLMTWPIEEIFSPQSPGFCVVVQSYLGYDPIDVRKKLTPFIMSDRYVGCESHRSSMEEDILIIETSGFLNSEWYLDQYPEVRLTGLSPAVHYLQYGARQLLDPGPEFSTAWYRQNNPDVDEGEVNPLVHYVKHGSKTCRYPSPYFMLRNKVTSSECECEYIFEKFSRLKLKRPQSANSNNWMLLKPEWARYYISKSAFAYSHNDFISTLKYLKHTIQIAADLHITYVLYEHIFRKLNYQALASYEKTFEGAELIVAHISCKHRLSISVKSVQSFNDENKKIRNITVIGDRSLNPNEFKFDSSLNLLAVPSEDSYEALPDKIRLFFLFAGFSALETVILKVDDNVHCKNIISLKKDLNTVISKHDYGGLIVGPQKAFLSCTFWHLNKCTDEEINDSPDSLPFLAPYVSGKTYWLSGEAVNSLSKLAIVHEGYFKTEIYEDRAIGTILNNYGFQAYHYNLVDSGSVDFIPQTGRFNEK